MGLGDRIRFRVEFLGALALDGILGYLPPRLGRALGRGLGRGVGLLARRRSQVAAGNLTQAFPEKTPSGIQSLVKGVWGDLGEWIWEIAQLGRMSPEDFPRKVDVRGGHHLRDAHAQGKGVLLLTGHIGNWEYSSYAVALTGVPLSFVARRMKNPLLNDWTTARRSRFNGRVLMHKNAVRESFRILKKGEVLGLLFDQRITDGGLQVPFFSRPAYTTGLPALLALRFGCPVIFVRSWRERGRVTVEIQPPVTIAPEPPTPERIAEVTSQFNAVLEGWVRDHPTQWLWIHNRWKP